MIAAAPLWVAFVVAACTPAPTASPASPSAPVSGVAATPSTPSAPSASSREPASPTASAAELTIDITIADGQVTPNAEKINVAKGTRVTLNVTSDIDDDIHAHTGGDGYELKVEAGDPTTGSFVASSPGSFEIESHHLEKVIVILNVR